MQRRRSARTGGHPNCRNAAYPPEQGVTQSIFTFVKGKGELIVERRLLNDVKDVEFVEYFTGAASTTEYQGDLSDVSLGVDEDVISYEYKGRKVSKKGKNAFVSVPSISSEVVLSGDVELLEAEEGIAFAPVYHLRAYNKGGIKTCLKLKRVH